MDDSPRGSPTQLPWRGRCGSTSQVPRLLAAATWIARCRPWCTCPPRPTHTCMRACVRTDAVTVQTPCCAARTPTARTPGSARPSRTAGSGPTCSALSARRPRHAQGRLPRALRGAPRRLRRGTRQCPPSSAEVDVSEPRAGLPSTTHEWSLASGRATVRRRVPLVALGLRVLEVVVVVRGRHERRRDGRDDLTGDALPLRRRTQGHVGESRRGNRPRGRPDDAHVERQRVGEAGREDVRLLQQRLARASCQERCAESGSRLPVARRGGSGDTWSTPNPGVDAAAAVAVTSAGTSKTAFALASKAAHAHASAQFGSVTESTATTAATNASTRTAATTRPSRSTSTSRSCLQHATRAGSKWRLRSTSCRVCSQVSREELDVLLLATSPPSQGPRLDRSSGLWRKCSPRRRRCPSRRRSPARGTCRPGSGSPVFESSTRGVCTWSWSTPHSAHSRLAQSLRGSLHSLPVVSSRPEAASASGCSSSGLLGESARVDDAVVRAGD